MTIHQASNDHSLGTGVARRQIPVRQQWKCSPPQNEHDYDWDCRFGPFRTNDPGKSIYCDNHLLHLTKKEYILLRFFVAFPGIVFSRRELAMQLWPDCPSPCMEAKEVEIKQFVYTLRRKLEESANKQSCIETVRGFGYRLVDNL